MFRTPRLIPTFLVIASLALASKLGVLWHDAGIAFAETAPAGGAQAAGGQTTAAPAAASGAGQVAPDAGTASATPAAPTPSLPPATAKAPEHFSAAEVALLQELSKRRDEIEKRGEDLDRRELLLKAAEQRVDEKIARLQQLQAAVDAAVAKSDQQDDQHIASLVHIYETMKPQEAARIFEGMDMPSLLQLLTRMKDLKTAPILAAMAPDKAREITVAMAQRKDIPDVKTN